MTITLTPPHPETPRRPFGVTIITLGVLSIACLNLTRLVLAIRQWQFLAGLGGVSPLYLVLTGLVWGVVGLVWVTGLWRSAAWAPFFTRRAVLIYTVYVWLERLLLVPWSADRFVPPNWAFSVGMNLVVLVVVYWVFSRKNTKAYFGVFNEPSS